MERADAVCYKDTEKPGIGLRVSARNIETVEAETIEGVTGLSDNNALSQPIKRADHHGDGIGGHVIDEHQPGDRIDLTMYRQARRRRRLASDQYSPGGDR